MYRDDSPDYSAPPRPGDIRSRSRSPSHRGRRSPGHSESSASGSYRRGRDDYDDKYRSPRRRTPSPHSPRHHPSHGYDRSPRSSRRSRSRSPRHSDTRSRTYTPESGDVKHPQMIYPWQDEETLRSLHCKDCNVTLNDRDSMVGHLKGTQHLMQAKRLKDAEIRSKTGGRSLNDVLVPHGYDENFWIRDRGPRKLRPEQERMLDTERLNQIPAKFSARDYDNGQYRFDRKELYCEDCDVWVRSRDQMQMHKEGANHKKKSAKVTRYRCDLCLIEVPCQDTLNNHMKGKDHIKREKQLQEQRRKRGEDSGIEGYKTGPIEMNKLSNDEYEELIRLRKENKILKEKVAELKGKNEKLMRNEQLRQQEMRRTGIIKKEEPRDDVPSTSSSQLSSNVKREVKTESRKHYRSGQEYLEDEDDIVLDD